MTALPAIAPSACGCDAPTRLKALIDIDTALARIAYHVTPVPGTETRPLVASLGRVLAAPVAAAAMTPPFDNAAMDGYAVATGALTGPGPWHLPVVARLAAGQPAHRALSGPVAMRIFTGAPVPQGADAVVMQEEVRRRGDCISLSRAPRPGQNIRRAGADMRPGQVVVAANASLGARDIAACAAAGAGTVRLRRPLRVALLITGDEIRAAGSGRAEAQIWDVNTPMLAAALAGPGLDIVEVSQAADSRADLARAFARLSGTADLIVTTGGVSVGGEDHVKPALACLGAEIFFSGVAIKPGKPVSCGRLGKAVWLGLPGNPLAAFVTWQLFGTAVIAALTGRTGPAIPRRHVVTGAPIRRKPGRCELRPARVTGFDAAGREVVAFDAETRSAHVAHLPAADGLIILPAETDALPEGALVEYHPFCQS